MSTPSQPLNIRSPNRLAPPDADGQTSAHNTPVFGTPDLRALRAGYIGTPPLPNIPPRLAGAPASRRGSSSVPNTGGDNSPRRTPAPGPSAIGGLSATRDFAANDVSPAQLDVDDEEKVRVLARHLVPKELRKGAGTPGTSDARSLAEGASDTEPTLSRRSSNGVGAAVSREESEPFPIPFSAHGGDVT